MRWINTSVFFTPVVILVLIAPALLGLERLAFRDISHFYTPLYDYVAERSSSQWLPLWNPLDQTGMPLLGETTTAVLYPIRYVLFALPISTEAAIAWYVAFHLILASLSARFAARLAGVRPCSAAIAGVVYPLSGSVLFLYTNPPFLVGAAWLPLVVAPLITLRPIRRSDLSLCSHDRERVIGGGFRRSAFGWVARIAHAVVRPGTVIASIAMAMMILAGDPQTALHAMIVVAAVYAIRLANKRITCADASALLIAPTLAALLAAPQLAASLSWSLQSERVGSGSEEHWYDPPDVGGNRQHAFLYSLPPWHAMELATPNACGSLLPVNRRISVLIPSDGQMWTPTIYMGMLVAIALLDQLWRPRRHSLDAWAGIMCAAFGLALGHFGFVWFIQLTTSALDDVDSAIGGPYWWLYQFLPGYDSFRYPTKWLPLFSLGASVLTAKWVDRARWRRCQASWWSLAVVTILGLGISTCLRWDASSIIDFTKPLPRDPFWGPLDVDGALTEIQHSFVHSALILTVIAILLRLARSRLWSRRQMATAFAALLLIELGLVGHGLVARVPMAEERELAAHWTDRPRDDVTRWMRTRTGGGWPRAWENSNNENRLLEVETSQRAAWFGRWHLAYDSAVFNNMVSMRSSEMAKFWQDVRRVTADMTPIQRKQFWKSKRRMLQIDGIVHTTAASNTIAIAGRPVTLVDVQRGADVLPNAQHLWSVEPESATLFVDLPHPRVVTRPVFQDGHWVAQYKAEKDTLWQPVDVIKVNQLTQGVQLPAGEWELRFRYTPWWIGWTLAVAGFTWVAILTLICFGNKSLGGADQNNAVLARRTESKEPSQNQLPNLDMAERRRLG